MITLNLTKAHLRLIPFVSIRNDQDAYLAIERETFLNIHNSLLEDVSLILGLRDKAIPKTEDDANGRAFPDEIEKYMRDVYTYVKDNLWAIETLIHQFAVSGGITEGTYISMDDESPYWEKKS